MNDNEIMLAFLEGTLTPDDREALLDRLDAEPELAEQLRSVAMGMDAAVSLSPSSSAWLRPEGAAEAASVALAATATAPDRTRGRGVSPWWLVAASVATLSLSVPVTLKYGMASDTNAQPDPVPATVALGMPEDSEPSFVLVLHGRWPDAGAIDATETRRRADEYWDWTTRLAQEGVLVAAGDLRWEPGERLGPLGVPVSVAGEAVGDPDFLVGMFTLRVSSYEEARAVAQACPHLLYGGSVSVRRVGSGFVTVPDMGDWSD